MEFLGSIAFGVVIAIPVIAIVALVKSIDARRRADENGDRTRDLQQDVAALRRELAHVTDRLMKLESSAAAQHPIEAQAAQPVGAYGAQSPADSSRPTAVPTPERPSPAAQPAAPAVAVPTQPKAAPAPAAEIPKPTPVAEPPKPVAAPAIQRPAPVPTPVVAPLRPPIPSVAAFEKPAQPQPARPEPAASARPAAAAPPPRSQAAPAPAFSAYQPTPQREGIFDQLKSSLPFEQFLGMNLFAKIGIILLVLGFALLGRMALVSMGPGPRVALIYGVGGALLAGGVWLERREKYRLIGRTGIGGGWALLFFTTYAMHHVPPMMVLDSNTADCVLMLVVAIGMVMHTLRYRSQLVTGLAFLLAFSTVALSQDSVYALAAGVILALGIVTIGLRMRWFELEVFGILSSYANHLYWLYRLYPDGVAGHAFPEFWPSAIILVLYWAIFRTSYIVRRVESPRQEGISTLAALANTLLLLVAMKFQSIHPELAFYALLGLGALEFLCGQLPVTRRRRAAFALLTVIGTLLLFSAIPFKFSGNNIALFWMIGAEALLVAGIVQRESVFRYLGLIAGCLTGLLIVFESQHIVELRSWSETVLLKDGILLLTASVLFYLNALFLRSRWREVFSPIEAGLAASQGYLGCITAFLGAWALFPADWTAIAWAALLVGSAFATRRLRSRHLLVQGWLLTLAVAVRAAFINCHFDTVYPHQAGLRLLTLPLLAGLFYLAGWLLSAVEDLPLSLSTVSLWLGSASLATLAWLELSPVWIAPVWAVLAVAFCFAGRRLHLRAFNFQEHVLAAAVAVQLMIANLDAAGSLERYLPFIGCAAIFYAISRISTQPDAPYGRAAAWLHTWTATGLLTALAWHESSQPWLAAIWILFALALATIDRIRVVEELPWQAHTLALLAVGRAILINFELAERWHGVSLRLITISILVTGLYALANLVRLPASLKNSGIRPAYSWVGTSLAAWLLWYELAPMYVAVGLAVLAVTLFEVGAWRAQKQLRLQAYALLAVSFGRIFFVNLSAAMLPGDWLNLRVYTVASLAVIYFYVWSRLRSKNMKSEAGGAAMRSLIAYFGTISVAALLYCEASPEWVIVAWCVVVAALMAASLALDEEVLLEHAALLTFGVVVRGVIYNLVVADIFAVRSTSYMAPALAAAVLFAALPLTFRVRSRYTGRPPASFISRCIAARHPEQILFFAPLTLAVLTIAIKMDPGMITLAWGIVGVLSIVLGLVVTERSYRLSGLILLLLCVGKIVFRDAWQFNERDRYITFIALGAALILVSALYSKFRGQVSRLL